MSMTESSTRRRRGRPAGPPVAPAERREQLLDATERVIERGVREPSFADIAAEAGYARTAVYAAFEDRADLASALAKRHTDGLVASAADIAEQAKSMQQLFYEITDLVCRFVETHTNLFPLIMQMIVSDSPGSARRPLFSDIADWVTGTLETALLRVGTDPAAARTWAAATAGAALLAAEDWNARRDRPRSVLVAEITELLWPGLAAMGLDAVSGPLRPAAGDE